ncbi:MAG: glycosyltransferase family 2 protein [Pseudomonadota bacterium]
MAEPPLFSIVIPCYNYGHWLERAVNSVLAQGGDDWDLLVIDDGSTDATAAVAQDLLARHPGRLRLLSQPNRGAAATRNRGLDATRGRYLIFLDADDELSPEALGAYRALLARRPDADLLAGAYFAVTEDGRSRLRPVGDPPASRKRRLRAYLFGKSLHLTGSAVAFRRGALAARRYPEHLPSTEDLPVFAHLLATGELAVTPIPVAITHRHPDSLRHDAARAAAAAAVLPDEVFRPDLMPDWALAWRERYRAQRHLSLFRTHYLAGEHPAALDCFHRALASAPLATLGRWSYLRKYLKLRCGLAPGKKS